MEKIAPKAMNQGFFAKTSRERAATVVCLNNFPYGVYIPCAFTDGEPDWEEVERLIGEARKDGPVHLRLDQALARR